MKAVLDAYFDGINGERYADVAALFAPDGEFNAPGVRPRRGREAIAAYYRKAAADGGWVADPALTPPARSALAGQYWSFGYKAGDRRFMVAGVEPGPALAAPPTGLPVVVRTNAE